MIIDWFTFVAQLFNFLVLAWLLKRFLYRPILNAVDLREKEIAHALASAHEQNLQAEKERTSFQAKNEEFEQKRQELDHEMANEIENERQRLIGEVRKNADDLNAKLQQSIIADVHNLAETVGELTKEEVFSITRKVLADLAAVSLEERMIEVLIVRIKELSSDQKNKLSAASGSNQVLIRSTFEINSRLCAALQKAVQETLGIQNNIVFEVAPNLVSGIELIIGGLKVSWCISDYLNSMQKTLNEMVETREGQ